MTRTGEITAPEKLTPEHDISSFKSGEPALDDWLKRRDGEREVGCLADIRHLRRQACGWL